MEKEFNIEKYIKSTKPLTDKEYKEMMSYNNKEISVDDLKDNVNFDCSKYLKLK